MNQYATLARQHWQRYLPSRYAQIEDPTAFFTELGEQISDQINDLTATLAGDDPPGESYLDKVGRLNAAGQMAREQILAQMLPAPEDDEETTPVSMS